MHRLFRVAFSAIAFALALSSCDQLRQVAVDQAGDFHENSEGSPGDPVELVLDVPHDGKVDNVNIDHLDTASSYYSFRTTAAGEYYCCVSNLSSNISSSYRYELSLSVSDTPSFSRLISGGETAFGNSLVLAADTEYFVRVTNTYEYYNYENICYSIAILSGDRSEGAPGSPVPIDPATGHAGVVGIKAGTNASSYYSFTAPRDGLYALTLGTEQWTCETTVYRDTAFTLQSANTQTSAIPLITGETVFLKMENTDSAVPVFIQILVTQSGDQDSDGTEMHPAQLELNTPFAGKIGTKGLSRYTFTTSTAGVYSCAASGFSGLTPSYSFKLYSDPACTIKEESLSWYGSPTSYNLPANATYYLLMEQYSSGPLTYALKVWRSSDASNDGFLTNPAQLQVGVPYAGKVGSQNGKMNRSWYSFTTGTAGAYAIAASGITGSLSYALYSKSDFTSSVTYAMNASVMLEAATTYYLKTWSITSSECSYSLLVSRVGDSLNEGSVEFPVQLTLGESHDGRVGDYYGSYGKSYYTFTAPSTGTYDFAIANLGTSLDFYRYSDSAFTVYQAHAYNKSGLSSQNLVGGTTYYFLVHNDHDSSVPCSYSLTVIKQ